MKTNPLLAMLRYYVTGSIERGEGQAIEGHPYDADKASHARYLGQLDRQMTAEEWDEFGELVRDGY